MHVSEFTRSNKKKCELPLDPFPSWYAADTRQSSARIEMNFTLRLYTWHTHARERESRDRYRRHGLPFHHHLLFRGVRNFIAPSVRCSRQEKTTKVIEGARARAPRSNSMLRSILKPIKTRDKVARTSARNIHLPSSSCRSSFHRNSRMILRSTELREEEQIIYSVFNENVDSWFIFLKKNILFVWISAQIDSTPNLKYHYALD